MKPAIILTTLAFLFSVTPLAMAATALRGSVTPAQPALGADTSQPAHDDGDEDPSATPTPIPPLPKGFVMDWDHMPTGSIQQAMIQDGLSDNDALWIQNEIYAVSQQYGVPSDVLFSAIYQESDFDHYGVNLDYGNYSCGVAQINISGWCQTIANDPKYAQKYNWPGHIKCDSLDDLNQKIMAPFLTAIQASRPMTKSGTEPADYLKLPPQQMIAQMPGGNYESKRLYYDAAMSFGAHCSDIQIGIVAMAKSLREVNHDYVPAELKRVHPHTAWVIADAIYNIGPVLVTLLQNAKGPGVWKTLDPQKVVDILSSYYAKRPANATLDTTFTAHSEDDGDQQVKYFMTCVNQRHIEHILRAALPPQLAGAINASTENCGDKD